MPGYMKSTCAMLSLGSMNGVGAPLRTPSCLHRIECEHKSCITQLNGKLLTSNIEGPCVPYGAHQALHPGSMPLSAHQHHQPDQQAEQRGIRAATGQALFLPPPQRAEEARCCVAREKSRPSHYKAKNWWSQSGTTGAWIGTMCVYAALQVYSVTHTAAFSP